jgi:hypothetical protein
MDNDGEMWTKMHKHKPSKKHNIKIAPHKSKASYTFKDENTVIVFTSSESC